MRKYVRHPSDIPIEYHVEDPSFRRKEYLNNISEGGLSFRSNSKINEGTVLSLRFPVFHPPVRAEGIVVWCEKTNRHFDVGVKFTDLENAFRIRMVEQICYIEHYKHEVFQKEGRTLWGEEAALEWILEEMRTIQAVTTTFTDDGQPKPLEEAVKVLLFQAVRELLNNIARHAKAKNTEVSIARNKTMVLIQVNDDGIGFEGSKGDTSKEKVEGFGLYSIKERLQYIGGTFTVESARNRGSSITLKAPLKS